MKFKKTFLAICIMIILFGVAGVTAGDSNDTAAAADEVLTAEQVNETVIGLSQDDTLGAGPGTFTELQIRIELAESGSTLTLNKDYTYAGNLIRTGVEINKDLTIDGQGHTLDGAGKSRIMLITLGSIKSNQVTLKNIKFSNANTELYGGAIFNYANLTLDNCEFINNHAKIAGGAVASVGHLVCKNSKFTTNVADGDGGAIFCLSIALHADLVKLFNDTVLNGNIHFLNNFTSYVTLKFADDVVSRCVFKGNVAKGRGGGAIYAFGNINIASSSFNSNDAGEKGGAVFANKNLYISSSKFVNSKVSKTGGAVYFRCHSNTGHYDSNLNWVSEVEYYTGMIKNSVFIKNSADKGGAIYGFKSSASDKHEVKAVQCTFEANKASTGRDIYGGSISKSVFNYPKLTMKAVKIKKSAKKLVLAAKLIKGKTPVKGKKIAFKFNGKTYAAKTDKNGIAKLTIKKSVLNKLKLGKKITYLAKYGKLTVKRTAKVIR